MPIRKLQNRRSSSSSVVATEPSEVSSSSSSSPAPDSQALTVQSSSSRLPWSAKFRFNRSSQSTSNTAQDTDPSPASSRSSRRNWFQGKSARLKFWSSRDSSSPPAPVSAGNRGENAKTPPKNQSFFDWWSRRVNEKNAWESLQLFKCFTRPSARPSARPSSSAPSTPSESPSEPPMEERDAAEVNSPPPADSQTCPEPTAPPLSESTPPSEVARTEDPSPRVIMLPHAPSDSTSITQRTPTAADYAKWALIGAAAAATTVMAGSIAYGAYSAAVEQDFGVDSTASSRWNESAPSRSVGSCWSKAALGEKRSLFT